MPWYNRIDPLCDMWLSGFIGLTWEFNPRAIHGDVTDKWDRPSIYDGFMLVYYKIDGGYAVERVCKQTFRKLGLAFFFATTHMIQLRINIRRSQRGWNQTVKMTSRLVHHGISMNWVQSHGQFFMGKSTISMGQSTISIGKSTISMGKSTISMGKSTISMGKSTISMGKSTISMGKSTISIRAMALPRRTVSHNQVGYDFWNLRHDSHSFVGQKQLLILYLDGVRFQAWFNLVY